MNALSYAGMATIDLARIAPSDPAAERALWARWEAEAAAPVKPRPERRGSIFDAFKRPVRARTERQVSEGEKRRRSRGGDGRLPDCLRRFYTEGQRAVLSVIAQDVARFGRCEKAVDAIAAIAGVCRRTVQTAVKEACKLGHLDRQERRWRGAKSDTNVYTVKALDWLSWLRPKPKPKAGGGIGCKGVRPKENKIQNKKEEGGKPPADAPSATAAKGLLKGCQGKTGAADGKRWRFATEGPADGG